MIKLNTPSHGYLIVPKVEGSEELLSIASKVCQYGYQTEMAYYLEEDCEAPKFISIVKERNN
jgi:hypothetical protein